MPGPKGLPESFGRRSVKTLKSRTPQSSVGNCFLYEIGYFYTHLFGGRFFKVHITVSEARQYTSRNLHVTFEDVDHETQIFLKKNFVLPEHLQLGGGDDSNYVAESEKSKFAIYLSDSKLGAQFAGIKTKDELKTIVFQAKVTPVFQGAQWECKFPKKHLTELAGQAKEMAKEVISNFLWVMQNPKNNDPEFSNMFYVETTAISDSEAYQSLWPLREIWLYQKTIQELRIEKDGFEAMKTTYFGLQASRNNYVARQTEVSQRMSELNNQLQQYRNEEQTLRYNLMCYRQAHDVVAQQLNDNRHAYHQAEAETLRFQNLLETNPQDFNNLQYFLSGWCRAKQDCANKEFLLIQEQQRIALMMQDINQRLGVLQHDAQACRVSIASLQQECDSNSAACQGLEDAFKRQPIRSLDDLDRVTAQATQISTMLNTLEANEAVAVKKCKDTFFNYGNRIFERKCHEIRNIISDVKSLHAKVQQETQCRFVQVEQLNTLNTKAVVWEQRLQQAQQAAELCFKFADDFTRIDRFIRDLDALKNEVQAVAATFSAITNECAQAKARVQQRSAPQLAQPTIMPAPVILVLPVPISTHQKHGVNGTGASSPLRTQSTRLRASLDNIARGSSNKGGNSPLRDSSGNLDKMAVVDEENLDPADEQLSPGSESKFTLGF